MPSLLIALCRSIECSAKFDTLFPAQKSLALFSHLALNDPLPSTSPKALPRLGLSRPCILHDVNELTTRLSHHWSPEAALAGIWFPRHGTLSLSDMAAPRMLLLLYGVGGLHSHLSIRLFLSATLGTGVTRLYSGTPACLIRGGAWNAHPRREGEDDFIKKPKTTSKVWTWRLIHIAFVIFDSPHLLSSFHCFTGMDFRDGYRCFYSLIFLSSCGQTDGKFFLLSEWRWWLSNGAGHDAGWEQSIEESKMDEAIVTWPCVSDVPSVKKPRPIIDLYPGGFTLPLASQ